VPVGASGAAVATVEAFDLAQADLHGGTIGLPDPGLTLERGMYQRLDVKFRRCLMPPQTQRRSGTLALDT
jgi:hypothetical protein